MARLIVTGASGLLGANLVIEGSADHDVVAVSNRHRMRFDHAIAEQVDLTEGQDVHRLFADVHPDAVIHCAAGTDIDELEQDPQLAMSLNCEMAALLARAAHAHGARFVHISTDAVFDGLEGCYSEDDPPRPLNMYGKSKLAGEAAVHLEYPQAVIVRTTIFGWSTGWKTTLAEWFVEGLEAGVTLPGFSNLHFSPILVNDLAHILLMLAASEASGVFHVPGADCVSKYEFGRRIAKSLGLDPRRIHETVSTSAGLEAQRPEKTCLRGEKIQQLLGIRLPTIDEGIQRLLELRRIGYTEKLRQAREDGDA
jgi:dTDP-4-dehydrorhamnose reductase